MKRKLDEYIEKMGHDAVIKGYAFLYDHELVDFVAEDDLSWDYFHSLRKKAKPEVE